MRLDKHKKQAKNNTKIYLVQQHKSSSLRLSQATQSSGPYDFSIFVSKQIENKKVSAMLAYVL